MKIKGYEKENEKVLQKIGSEGNKLLKKMIAEIEWNDRSINVNEKKGEYLELGYNSDEIEVIEVYTLHFHNTDVKIEKQYIIKNQHTQKKVYCGEKYIDYVSEYFTKKRNEIGVQLREMYSEAKEEIVEENSSEEDEE